VAADQQKQTETERRRIISAAVPISVARELRSRAAREDRSLSAELRRAIRLHLQRDEVAP
jgi:hypothetical protein